MSERFALYWTPDPDEDWGRAVLAWWGEATGVPVPPELAALAGDEQLKDARRYGLHMTLKAPFRLADGATAVELIAALAEFAAGQDAVTAPAPVVSTAGGFLSLRPAAQSPALQDLAAAVVTAFDRFRAPLSEADRARRGPLPPDQQARFERWGYPYVFDAFRPHVTLAGRGFDPALPERMAGWLGPLLPPVWRIGSLSLFHEAEAGAAFVEVARVGLGRG